MDQTPDTSDIQGDGSGPAPEGPAEDPGTPPSDAEGPSGPGSDEQPDATASSEAAAEHDAHLPPNPPARWGIGLQSAAVTLAFGAAAVGSFLLFRMLNRTKVHGLENIPSEHENVLYCLNHNSILDNFAFEVAAYIPKLLFQPKYLPISLADRQNFFGNPASRRFRDRVLTMLGQHFFRNVRAYPVDRKASDLGQVDQWIRLLKENIVIVFPEGTRTRTGKIGPAKPGVGKMIYESRPRVIPVRMDGTGDILGVGVKVPNVFRTVEVWIGEPMDLSHFLDRPLPTDRKEQMRFFAEIAESTLDAIRALGPGSDWPETPEEAREREDPGTDDPSGEREAVAVEADPATAETREA